MEPATSPLVVYDSILVVDDNQDNLEVLEEILQSAGYKACSACNGKEALLSLDTETPLLILSDIKMPEMDGYELCQRVKANERTNAIPVFLISVYDDEISRIKGYQAGAADFISKPFSKSELLAKMNIHIKLRQMQINLESQNEMLKKEILIRKQAEVEAEFERNLITALMNNFPGAIYFKDLNSRFTRLSRSWATKFNDPNPESYIGLSDFDVFSHQH
ncbi:MAG TPA: response regulator, partial [Bacteroidales bacterium]